jgi:glycine/D-amino acid oxidase-like deaminating enzyme
VDYTWACFRPAHPDHLPIVDRLPGFDNVWMTTGHYKTGILLAPGTANALVTWMQTGRRPVEVEPFGLARVPGVA